MILQFNTPRAKMPPRVKNHYAYWINPPPVESPRCTAWVDRIAAGWRPNRRIRQMGYDESAQWFGVWMWEYLNVISPMLYR